MATPNDPPSSPPPQESTGGAGPDAGASSSPAAVKTEDPADDASRGSGPKSLEPQAPGGVPPPGTPADPPPPHGRRELHGKELAVYMLTALGVVYGDIGTSPLYALRECFHGAHAIAATPGNILGVVSLIFWALILSVSVYYLGLILRADNNGEGGILALMALALTAARKGARQRRRAAIVVLGLFGAALLYGDGVITPAISVLSAWEGLRVWRPELGTGLVVNLTLITLVGLFLVQRRGTAKVGRLFGPVMLVWFATLGGLGLRSAIQNPAVFQAINPVFAVRFFMENGWHGFLILGSVFLVVTGNEALYADLGHFGPRPIRRAWFSLVLPGLLLNYFGQAALLLRSPEAAENPFYRLAPAWALVPLVFLAMLATVIASQALISGAFSITQQAVQLGYIPRVEIIHTSEREKGQIYIPFVNWALLLAVIPVVLAFRSSSNLAAAYGIAVVTTMVITTLLTYVVVTQRWGWRPWVGVLVILPLLTMDVSFFVANIVKFFDGGFFPLIIGALIFMLMTTWKTGRQILSRRLQDQVFPLEYFLASLQATPPVRVPGTAVFMTGNASGTPPALLHNWKHNKVIHERVVLLTVSTEDIPHVADTERMEISSLEQGFFRIVVRYGFMESPSVPEILKLAKGKGMPLKLMETSFFLGRETLIPTKQPGMAIWREALFAWMSRNARPATAFFKIPPNRVVELGSQIEL